MKIKFVELIKKNLWLNVEENFLGLYPKQKKNISEYEKIFNHLKILQPENSKFTLNLVEVKDDFDEEIYVDVSGYLTDEKKNTVGNAVSYALEFTPWEEWLGMDIDKKSTQVFSESEIISHCLYEMTFYGFTQKKIQNEWRKIKKSVKKIEKMTPEEKQKRIISWKELKKELNSEDEGNEKIN